MFQNRVLRKIIVLERDEVTGGWINSMKRSFII
jgi:hypothetical protein